MTDSILYLLAILVAANVVLIGVAITRSAICRRRAKREATLQPASTARPMASATNPPTEGPVTPAAAADRGPILAATRDAHVAPPRTDALTGLLLRPSGTAS